MFCEQFCVVDKSKAVKFAEWCKYVVFCEYFYWQLDDSVVKLDSVVCFTRHC